MKHLSTVTHRARTPRRLLAIGGGAILYLGLAWLNHGTLTSLGTFDRFTFWQLWLPFGFSLGVAAIFLAMGAIVWYYGRARGLAILVFGLCLCLMSTFAVQTGATAGSPLLSLIGLISSRLGLYLLALMLLIFPRNLLIPHDRDQGSQRHLLARLLWGYIATCTCFGCGSFVYAWGYFALPPAALSLLYRCDFAFLFIAIVGSVGSIIVSYCVSASSRERMQRRLVLVGVLLALVPIFLLLVLPTANTLFLAPSYWTHEGLSDSRLISVTVIFLPLALGYAILRYHLLVLDSLIRRVLTGVFRSISIALTGYLVVVSAASLWQNATRLMVAAIIVTLVLLIPGLWQLSARLATLVLPFEQLRDLPAYPDLVVDIALSDAGVLSSLARQLGDRLSARFGTDAVALLLLDEATDSYHQVMSPAVPISSWVPDGREVFVEERVSLHSSLVTFCQKERQPYLWSSYQDQHARRPMFAAYGATSSLNPLLAPLWWHGHLIGMALLGERANHELYAGPDLEPLSLILAQWAPRLGLALQSRQEERHEQILAALSRPLPLDRSSSLEDAMSACLHTITQALPNSSAEYWHFDPDKQRLSRLIRTGKGPLFSAADTMHPTTPADWSAAFLEAQPTSERQQHQLPLPTLLQAPQGAVAWLPLIRVPKNGETEPPPSFGVLVLCFEPAHRFRPEEQILLKTYARSLTGMLTQVELLTTLRTRLTSLNETALLKRTECSQVLAELFGEVQHLQMSLSSHQEGRTASWPGEHARKGDVSAAFPTERHSLQHRRMASWEAPWLQPFQLAMHTLNEALAETASPSVSQPSRTPEPFASTLGLSPLLWKQVQDIVQEGLPQRTIWLAIAPATLRALLSYAFQLHGYEVLSFPYATQMLAQLADTGGAAKSHPSVLLVDQETLGMDLARFHALLPQTYTPLLVVLTPPAASPVALKSAAIRSIAYPFQIDDLLRLFPA